MKKILQVYMGGVSGRTITRKEIEAKLAIASIGKIDGIIAGWSLNKEIYLWLRDYTKAHEMEYYLWFQVLSEFKGLKNFSPIKDIEGNEIKAITFDGDEEFLFYCPSHKDTIPYLKEIYEEHFSEIGFDGVFLDRIRFPSLTVDEKALFSCCCEACMEKYAKFGIRKEEIQFLKAFTEENKNQDNRLDMDDYQDGKYRYKTKEMEHYLYARTELITETVQDLSNYFKEKGMKVGLDLFAPFLSVFVGQNYEKLSACADFIKPMLYRYTDTPAGMNYELKGMIKALSVKKTEQKKLELLKKMIHMEAGAISEFMIHEVENAKKMSACEVLAGMEIHTIPTMKNISPIQISEGVKKLEEIKVSGRIASWNLLAAKEENILAFMGGR